MLRIAIAVAAGWASLGAQTPPSIRVGPNVQVSSAHPQDTHYEVFASAHTRDPSRLVVGSIIYSSDGAKAGTVVYASTDAGATWAPTLDGKALERTGDPATAFGPDGAAYYVVSVIPPGGERRLLLFRAPDGGTKWAGPFPLTYMDREYIVADATAGSRRGRVYVTGNSRVPRDVSDFVAYRSTDDGLTFSGPGTRPKFGSATATAMGNAVIASDGTLVGVFAQHESGSPRVTLSAIRSVDGGVSLTEPRIIGDLVPGGERKGAVLGNANSEPIVAIDATSGAFADRMYVVWSDHKTGHSQILFAASSDRGLTWSTPRVINDNAPSDTTDQFMPVVAVNRDGVVGVSWYDRRNRPDNLGWDVRFAASVDGGATFSPSVTVSEHGSTFPPGTTRALNRAPPPTDSAQRDRAVIAAGRESFRFMGGDTAGLAADAAGLFHPVWVDNHTGVPQVWTAQVTVKR